MPILAQISEVMKVVDHASGASDRWLFIACLAIIVVGGGLVIKWLVAFITQQSVVHDKVIESQRMAHASERAEWKLNLLQGEKNFLEALDKQRADFRAELLMERQGCAAERVLDRAARHATAEALNSVGLSLSLIHELNPDFRAAFDARRKTMAQADAKLKGD